MSDKQNRQSDNKENYGLRIRQWRNRAGLTQSQLAKALHLNFGVISHWENGRAKPELSLVPKLCEALHITLPEFFDVVGTTADLTYAQQQHLRNYNLLSPTSRKVIDKTMDSMLTYENERLWEYCKHNFHRILRNDQRVCAGVFNPLESDEAGEYIDVRSDALTRRADEIIVVSGDSMEPTFSDGDELLVAHRTSLRYGDIGIFVINGEGFVKEYRENGVYSHNSSLYPFRKFCSGDDVHCIGQVLGKLSTNHHPNERERMVLDELRAEETAAR